jgi:hypothetical protein
MDTLLVAHNFSNKSKMGHNDPNVAYPVKMWGPRLQKHNLNLLTVELNKTVNE